MEFLFLLMGPVSMVFFVLPWILGLVSIIKYFSRKKNSDKIQIADDLIKQSEKLVDRNKAEGLMLAARYLKGQEVFEEKQPENNLEPAPSTVGGENLHPEYFVKTLPTDNTNVAVSKNIKTIDNINILLYLGAFLVVVAAGIFVGYNYQLLSGIAKTIFLSLFVAAFYLSGMYLFLKTEKMKPAGATFTTIGIVLFPLIGLAYYKFVDNGQNGNYVWFVTSALTLIFYSLSLKYIRQVYLQYLTSFISLSLFESIVSLFDVPTYYFFWGMTIFSLLAAIATRKQKNPIQITHSLEISTKIIQPLSILLSLIMISTNENGWLGAGINLLLASAYYFVWYHLSNKEKDKDAYLVLALIVLPFGLAAILKQYQTIAIYYVLILLFLSLAYTFASSFFYKYFSESRKLLITVLSGLVVIFSIICSASDNFSFASALTVGLLVVFYNLFLNKHYFNALLSAIILLLIPFSWLNAFSPVEINTTLLSLLYLCLTGLFLGINYLVKRLNIDLFFQISRAAFVISSILTIAISYNSNNHQLIFLSELMISLLYLIFSEWSSSQVFTTIATLLMYLSAWQIAEIFRLDKVYFSWIAVAIGAIFYFVGEKRGTLDRTVWKFMGLLGSYIAALSMFVIKGGNDIGLVLTTAIAGVFSYYHTYKENHRFGQYFSIAILVTALELFYDFVHIDEQHIFTATWAIYFAWIAYQQHLKNKFNDRDFLAVIALGLLTVPLFFQAASDYDHGQIYGLILGIECIIILLAGMSAKYKLMKWWGSIGLLIIVADQTKDAILALPKWVIIGAVGLLFLGGATYLLSKKSDGEKNN